MTTGKTIALTIWTFVGKVVSLLFNALYRFVIVFLPRSKRLIISWLQSTSTVILEPKKIKSATVFTFFPSICHEVAFSLAKPYSSGFCSNSLPGPLFSKQTNQFSVHTSHHLPHQAFTLLATIQ